MTAASVGGYRERTITIGMVFSRSPGGRYRAHGLKSGEEFRDDYLVPALNETDHVTVNLDGTDGYAGSFLEEAFGGLIRSRGFTLEQLRHKLTISAEGPQYEIYRKLAESYLNEAAATKKTA